MANPPITVGAFTNVPAPGSPIRSDWPQSATPYLVHVFASTTARDAWASPPNGAICEAPQGSFFVRIAGAWRSFNAAAMIQRGQFPNLNTTGTGTFDLFTIGPTTYPHPVRCFVNVSFAMSPVAGAGSYNIDVVPLSTGTPLAATGTTYCPQSYWTYTTYQQDWSVAAGQQVGVKARVNVVGSGGGVFATTGSMTLQAVAT